MTNNLPKALIFDWDNTLVEGWSKIQYAINSVFRHYNMPEWDLKTVAARAHRSARDSFPEYFGDETENALKIFYDSYKACELVPAELDGAEETLQLLDDASIFMAIVSNKNGDLLRKEVEEKSWDKYFSKVIGATDCREDKPSVIPMLEIIAGQNWDASEIWFMGDTKVDVEFARNFGCKAITYGIGNENNADMHFDTHSDLHEFLKST